MVLENSSGEKKTKQLIEITNTTFVYGETRQTPEQNVVKNRLKLKVLAAPARS
ncbi:hypothetical protein YC2023_062256 [Brassica napus]